MIVIAVATSIMEEAMIGEIKATIKDKMDGKYTEEEIDKAMEAVNLDTKSVYSGLFRPILLGGIFLSVGAASGADPCRWRRAGKRRTTAS